MAFSVNTNIASLQAQNYLKINSDFQSKTINRVTSGLRIVSSGDDAAGLAIANGFRSDQAVLTQGIRNANDGLSTLQTIDGGMNNISQLLDRARTLATQSASGTFTGDRGVLNNEFQSVLTEIDRQAQSIGLDRGGQFAKSLSVFIGGGKANNGTSIIQNGSVGVDLSSSTVDTKSLGLKGSPASNSTTYSLASGSATSVSTIVSKNSSDTTADFYFSGPGFSTDGKIKVSVSTSGMKTGDDLANALNTAIATAANGATTSATSFKNAGISAKITTDASGNQQLAFSSDSAAFQVEAGNTVANAFMGNFASATKPDGTGSSVGATITAGTGVKDPTADHTVTIRIQGGSLASPVDLSFDIKNAEDQQVTHDRLLTAVAGNDALKAAGISVVADSSFSVGDKLQFASSSGESFSVAVSGDTTNDLGFGSFKAGTSNAFDYTSTSSAGALVTAGAGPVYQQLQFSLNGNASDTNVVNISSGGAALLSGGVADLSKLKVGDTITLTDEASTSSTYTLVAGDLTSLSTLATNMTTTFAALAGSPAVNAVGGRLEILGGTAGAAGKLTVSGESSTGIAAALGFAVGQTASGTAASQTAGQLQTQLNTQFQANAAMKAAGMAATLDGSGKLVISSNGTSFRMTSLATAAGAGATDILGVGITGADYAGATASAISTTSNTFSSGGVNQSSKMGFSAVVYGGDKQTVTVTSADTTGANQTSTIELNTSNARSIDEAVASINDQLQSSNNTTLMKIVAMKVNDAGTEKVQFASGSGPFTVSLSSNANTSGLNIADKDGVAQQNVSDDSTVEDGGANADVATQTGAQAAVSALADAVSSLGQAQAVVGKGQNNFNYAINLAQSQVTNLAAAESRIRDADLAQEAANLSKAQILMQAGTAALAQANSAPQAILSLLRG